MKSITQGFKKIKQDNILYMLFHNQLPSSSLPKNEWWFSPQRILNKNLFNNVLRNWD